jgi:hypothetical protein
MHICEHVERQKTVIQGDGQIRTLIREDAPRLTRRADQNLVMSPKTE